MESIQAKLKKLPQKPGVYLFKNQAGEVIYVGKAKNLRLRVKSYFTKSHGVQPRTKLLVSQTANLDYIICDTETESLILENNLIKKHQPRYNVLLRDDKNFQFIKIDYSTEIPQIYTTHRINENAQEIGRTAVAKRRETPPARYFGPYTSAKSVKELLHLIRQIFSCCANKKIGNRPCFYYHLGRCPGICVGKITLEEYRKNLIRIEKFLRGDLKTAAAELKREMNQAAKKRQFEKAARLRDRMLAITKIFEQQKIVSPRRENFDTVSLWQIGELAAITLFQIRLGRMVGAKNFLLDNTKRATVNEILERFLTRYYLEASDIPEEINIPLFPKPSKTPPEISNLQKILSKKTGKRIQFAYPVRGRKHQLIKLGETNASDYLEKTSYSLAREQAVITRALFELKDKLKLEEVPLRIEAYDISNIQGASAVGSLVVFENGKPKKSEYKRFAIRSVAGPNDVAMMKEMLARRFTHSSAFAKREDKKWKLPDLIVVDGGRAQLNAALKILQAKNYKLIPVIGLAKRLEEIYRPNIKNPLHLPRHSPALHLLQRVRDEAHRFALAYHRKKRTRQMLED